MCLHLVQVHKPTAMEAPTSTEVPGPTTILDLPADWWVHFLQRLASDTDAGVRTVAALDVTCKTIHALTDESAYNYLQIRPVTSYSPADPFWLWLATRGKGRTPGLKLEILPFQGRRTSAEEEQQQWGKLLPLLLSVLDLYLTVEVPPTVKPHQLPYVTGWLREYSDIISEIHVMLLAEDNTSLNLEGLVEVVSPCTKALRVCCDLPGSCEPLGRLTGLTSLDLWSSEVHDTWRTLATLTGLKKLDASVVLVEDASPLSALTGLTSLELSHGDPRIAWLYAADGASVPIISSLQPLSTMQQLEELRLGAYTCTSTSLQGLGGLDRLREVTLDSRQLLSLQGLSPGVTSLRLKHAKKLRDLEGIGDAISLQRVDIQGGGIVSLQALSSLSSLRSVTIGNLLEPGAESEPVPLRCDSLEVFQASGSCLESLSLSACTSLISLCGVHDLRALRKLSIERCSLADLELLAGLGSGLKYLCIRHCAGWAGAGGVLELPHVQPAAQVDVCNSGVEEVVLAGGVCRGAS